ncbi:hypothetical protein DL98DRAFT_512173 [Cadophora sp. DSE1049]|nr:hypothetical protein DL98DRAFT_512173 [Cadophora sp. DSE1049]
MDRVTDDGIQRAHGREIGLQLTAYEARSTLQTLCFPLQLSLAQLPFSPYRLFTNPTIFATSLNVITILISISIRSYICIRPPTFSSAKLATAQPLAVH